MDRLNLPSNSGLSPWLHRVYEALSVTNRQYPFLAYGTDWLAFANKPALGYQDS